MPASLALELECHLVPFGGEASGAFLGVIDLVPPDESASPTHELVQFLVVPVVGIAFGTSLGDLVGTWKPFMIALVAVAYLGIGEHAEGMSAFGALVCDRSESPDVPAVGTFVLPLYWRIIA